MNGENFSFDMDAAVARGKSSLGLGVALVVPYSSPTFTCVKPACIKEMEKRMGAWNAWVLAESALLRKRQITRCDFCLKFAEKVKR